jgi:glycosyltransferase involved in cell wall biosynthesis
MGDGAKLRVLVLARNYPSPTFPLLGLWVARPTAHLRDTVDVEVVSPVPWFPPLPAIRPIRRFTEHRKVAKYHVAHGIEIHRPRFPLPPGYRFHALEARGYELGIRRFVNGLRRWFAFDVIHAHLSYPDGVVAAQLGRRYDVPVVVTEHAPWRGWMDKHPSVRRQTVRALRSISCHTAVSTSVGAQIQAEMGRAHHVRVVPNGVDEAVFHPLPAATRDPNKVLFVGFPRPAKGVDILVDAMIDVIASRPDAHLVIVGGSLYRAADDYIAELHTRAARPPLRGHVSFAGPLPPPRIAHEMATSAVLVLPSRSESFGAVLVEALACGTPVVASRCGGPEDIVTEDVGRLVSGDAPALAAALLDVLSAPDRFEPEQLHRYAVERFSWDRVADEFVGIYHEVVGT